eukprot:11368026-Heterocapsa_arctica.AAC.1
MRARPSGYLGKARAGKSKARVVVSSAFSPVAPGRRPGKPNSPGKVLRQGNALSVKQKGAACRNRPSIHGGSAPAG